MINYMLNGKVMIIWLIDRLIKRYYYIKSIIFQNDIVLTKTK